MFLYYTSPAVQRILADYRLQSSFLLLFENCQMFKVGTQFLFANCNRIRLNLDSIHIVTYLFKYINYMYPCSGGGL